MAPKSKRERVSAKPLYSNLDQVDQAIADAKELDRQLDAIDAEAERQIDEIKKQAKEKPHPSTKNAHCFPRPSKITAPSTATAFSTKAKNPASSPTAK
jgi:hypothetical protein